MADFERLDASEAARFVRWQRFEATLFAARVVLVQASVRAALAQRIEPSLDPSNPATPGNRARMLQIRADSIRAGKRAVVTGRLALVRLSGLLDSRRAP